MHNRQSLTQFESDAASVPLACGYTASGFAGKPAGDMNAGRLVARRHLIEIRIRHVRLFKRDPRLQRMSNRIAMAAIVGGVE